MELEFTRLDLMQCGALNRKTLKVLPMGKKKQQKVVVGDETGVLSCFGVTKGVIVNRFRTLPSKEVSRVELGGPTKSKKDKIFAAAGQTIFGVTKKGKEFFRFETTLTETIHSMHIEGLSIWTGGEYMYNQFIDGKDKQFFMSSDRINDLFCTNITSDTDYDAVLACQDRFVRVIQGSDLLYEVRVEGAATTVDRMPQDGKAGKFSTNKEILYGTSTGTLGQLLANNTTIDKGWTLEPEKRSGGVNCIAFYDVTKRGLKDIVVGRDDGTIEVLAFEQGPTPKVIWKTNINESIQSLEIGQITAPGIDELVVGSYSGKIMAFSPVFSGNRAVAGIPEEALQQAKITPAAAQEEASRKIRLAQQELDKLAEKLKKEKEKHQKVSASAPIPAQQTIKVQTKFELTQDGTYILTLEVKMPIENLILHADVPLDIEECDKSQCMLSRTKTTEEGTYLLATCKLTETTNRVELKVRTIEGQFGSLNVYVIPIASPKQAQLVSFSIKPLSLHQRVNESKDSERRLLNEVKLTGSFSVSEVHAWISLCLPEIPDKITSEEAVLNFESAFVGTILQCSYKKGEASFRSDNMHTLSVLKDFITREATLRKAKFNISVANSDESVNEVLDFLNPKLEYQFSLSSKVKLINALTELKLQEPDVNFLSAAYADILQNADKIKKEHELQPRTLEQLFGVIVDLYVSKYKFKGKKVTGKESELRKQLASYNLVNLKAFFNTPI